MDATQIALLRRDLKLSQAEFAQLLGAHAMTISKWERGALSPSSYQVALLSQFRRTVDAQRKSDGEKAKNLLVGAGVIAALVWLLGSTK